jgi:hypothetical protein
VQTGAGSCEQFTLYCFCGRAHVPNRWKWLEAKPCWLSTAAHERGYGTLDEILPLNRESENERPIDIRKYLNSRQS